MKSFGDAIRSRRQKLGGGLKDSFEGEDKKSSGPKAEDIIGMLDDTEKSRLREMLNEEAPEKLEVEGEGPEDKEYLGEDDESGESVPGQDYASKKGQAPVTDAENSKLGELSSDNERAVFDESYLNKGDDFKPKSIGDRVQMALAKKFKR